MKDTINQPKEFTLALPLDQSKKGIQNRAAEMAALCENPLDVFVAAKRLEDLAKALRENLSQRVLDSFEEDDQMEVNGATLKHYSSMRHSFDHSEKWQELKNEIKRIEGLMKAAAKSPGKAVFDDDGTQIEPALMKPSAVSIRINY